MLTSRCLSRRAIKCCRYPWPSSCCATSYLLKGARSACFFLYGSSYHAKKLVAANQTSRRLQNLQLQQMHQELQLLEQQLEIERASQSTTVSFLNSKANSLHDATVSWHARQEEDALTKEREIEVRHCLTD